MIKEALILAGGKGTRLQSIVNDVPKPMADINGLPFLTYLFEYLINNKIKKVILSVCYKYDTIIKYYGNKYKNLELIYAIEENQLGTGGGIINSLKFTSKKYLYLLNGDTYFNVNLNKMFNFHLKTKADFSIAIKPLKNITRYGTVEITSDRITSFNEKQNKDFGLINGGIYIIDRTKLESIQFVNKFSFETDFLEKYCSIFTINGFISDSYFIDIGIPEDYQIAKNKLKNFHKLLLNNKCI